MLLHVHLSSIMQRAPQKTWEKIFPILLIRRNGIYEIAFGSVRKIGQSWNVGQQFNV
jgi:hypothetical protein